MDRDEMVRLIDRYAANVGEFILLNLPESCIERQMTGDLKEKNSDVHYIECQKNTKVLLDIINERVMHTEEMMKNENRGL